jgi:Ca2+-binding EF-hand superfamily protein
MIDPNMHKEDIEHIFNNLDTDNDNLIGFEELKNWLDKN